MGKLGRLVGLPQAGRSPLGPRGVQLRGHRAAASDHEIRPLRGLSRPAAAQRRFVDLFAVVRGGLVASESDYSLKSMEVFYGIKREGEVVTAGIAESGGGSRCTGVSPGAGVCYVFVQLSHLDSSDITVLGYHHHAVFKFGLITASPSRRHCCGKPFPKRSNSALRSL